MDKGYRSGKRRTDMEGTGDLMWLINRNLRTGKEEYITSKDWETPEEHGLSFVFRLEMNQQARFQGYSSERSMAPLDEFGVKVGCDRILYKKRNKWIGFHEGEQDV